MSIECKAVIDNNEQVVAIVTTNEIEKSVSVLNEGEVVFKVVRRMLPSGKILVSATDPKTGYTQEEIVDEPVI